MCGRILLGIWLSLLLGTTSVYADYYPDVPPMYRAVANASDVPPKVFFALILNESRTAANLSSGRRVLPWPWTVNHRGKPFYFPTRQDAYEYIQTLIDQGDYQFDVGLGQINWRWHKHRFENAWHALEPVVNLSVAAGFLREQYERPECNSWLLALGCYHRPGQRPKDKRIAKIYRNKVIEILDKM